MKSLMNGWVAAMLTSAILLSGCNRTNDAPTPGDVAEGDVAAAQTVTVTGSVEKLLDQRTFTMSGTAEIFSDNLAVVSRTALPTLAEGDEIEVTGTVHKVNHIEIERETSWTFDPQVTVELEDVTGAATI